MAITKRPFPPHEPWASLQPCSQGRGVVECGPATHPSARDRAVWQEGLARFVMSEIWFRVQHWGNQSGVGLSKTGFSRGGAWEPARPKQECVW